MKYNLIRGRAVDNPQHQKSECDINQTIKTKFALISGWTSPLKKMSLQKCWNQTDVLHCSIHGGTVLELNRGRKKWEILKDVVSLGFPEIPEIAGCQKAVSVIRGLGPFSQ